MKNTNILFSAIAVLLIAIGFASCKDKPSSNKLTVGVHSWPGGGIVYIGEKMGYFKEQKIDLAIKKIENFDTKRASLISGDIDVDVANTMDQLLIYNENDFPAQIIGITDESVGGDGVVVRGNIQTFADLKGKTVAYAEASPSDFFLRYLLMKNGLSMSDIKTNPVADAQIAGSTILAGKVDAAVTYEPYLTQAKNTTGNRLLASTAEYPTLIPGLLIASGDRVKANEDLYSRFVSAWFRSAGHYYSHKEESQKIIADGMGMKLEEVKSILKAVAIQTSADNVKHIDKATKGNMFELVQNISTFWKASGFIKKQPDPAAMINTKLISGVETTVK